MSDHHTHTHGDGAPPLGPRAHVAAPGEPGGFWDDKGNVDQLLRLLYAVAGLLVVLDLFVHRHVEHPWEHLVAFYPLYGFVGIVILVAVAKVLRRLVMRPEGFYDAD